jgi:tetratricopeptide (TPR) repeat protein
MNTITLNAVILPSIGVVISALCIGYIYRYIAKHQNHKDGLFFLSWLVIGLTLQLHIIPLDVTYAERWFYFSTAGMLSFIVLGIYAYHNYHKRGLGIVWLGVIILIFLAGRSIARTFDWRDSYTLLQKDLKNSSDNYYLENLLATLYLRDRKYAEAKPLIASSLTIHPFVGNLTNRAIIAVYEHDYKTAEEYYTKALVSSPLYQANINYANFLYYILHDQERAAIFAQNSLLQYPKSGELWAILAQWYYQQHKLQEAYEAADKAYFFMPMPLTQEVLDAIKQKRPLQIEGYVRYE